MAATSFRPSLRRLAGALALAVVLASAGDGSAVRAAGSADRDTGYSTETTAQPAETDFASGVATETPVRAVATFESLGLYWRPAAATGDCQVRYRTTGTQDWRLGFPLWFDVRDGECRGSLVRLTPDTSYDVELLNPATGALGRVQARTWSEKFPIARTVYLPDQSTDTLVIEDSGGPDGYVLYAPRPGASATIDVSGRAESNIAIKASYVIVRGLTLRNARQSAIVLDKDVHDVVIEENDVSGWGRVHPDGWGENMDAAIYSSYAEDAPLERLIIQRNRLHHPRAGSNAWDEYRRESDTVHPLGPQGISLWNTRGNNVIRYNEIFSDDEHKFNDCIGGGSNYTERGSPHRDSDIYGNRLSQCWDDAIEAEGGNVNVRIWGNYMDLTYVSIAVAPTVIGPIYIWRNVADRSRQSGREEMAKAKRGVFLKTQNKKDGDPSKTGRNFYGDNGRIYVFHNTLLQRDGENNGVYAGLSDLSGRMGNVTSRNNILHVNADSRPSIADSKRGADNDFDYDLYNGRIAALPENEKNGVQGVPIYSKSDPGAPLAQDSSSPGYDAGVVLPNFNDGFTGAAPDMGAQEAGTPPLQFGVDAYR